MRKLMSWFRGLLRNPGRLARRRTPAFLARAEALEARVLPTVVYNGGPLLQQVEVQPLYYGSGWNTDPLAHSQISLFNNFLSDIVQSSLMSSLQQTGYQTGRGAFDPGLIDATELAAGQFLTDDAIQSAIQSDISRGLLISPDPNRLYFVFVQPGTVVETSNGDTSSVDFYGYHNAFTGLTFDGSPIDVHYAVIPYQDGPNSPDPKLGNLVDSMTVTSSHELVESATDPLADGSGWYDIRKNGEIADLTNKVFSLDGFAIQTFVNQKGHSVKIPGTVKYRRKDHLTTPVATDHRHGQHRGEL